MKKNLLKSGAAIGCLMFAFGVSQAQISFSNQNSLLHSSTGTAGSNTNKRSGNSVTVVDMNNDGLDDICHLMDNGEIRIEYQQPGGTFVYQYIGTMGSTGAWAMCAGDVDKNGYKDIITGYGSSLKIMKLNASGQMGSVQTLSSSNFFVQNMNFMDVDGDTWIDIFACDDNAYGKIYRNDGTGNFYILAHSTTSLTIGTGSKSLTVSPTNGVSLTAGQTVKVGFSGDNYMQGTVTSYNTSTGALVVNVTSVTGSGTYATWSVDKDIVLNTQLSTQTVSGDPYDSGNYGTVWTDFDNDGDVDLYIAKCRQAASSSSDYRRKDVLFRNDGNGNYTESAANYGLGSYDQDWTSSFGDIDNDGDMDLFLTKHNTNSRLYINDGTGNYTGSNSLTFGSMPMQAQFEDFDNDGFVDLIITGDNAHKLYRNNQNSTFSDVTPSGFTAGTNILSFATGDLNHDGKIDVYASYGGTYNNPSNSVDDIYWQNSTSNSNHFITLVLTPSLSNNDALGTKAMIYGSWGVQVREVRAGESYGTLNSSHLHFGIGTATSIDSVVVNWPSGIRTVIANPSTDLFLNVYEQNPCTLSGASAVATGATTFCSGQSVTIDAVASGSGSGYTYLWSNGATTSSIVVTSPGSYAVTITESSQCHSLSNSVDVVVDPDETPSITAAADTVFCSGDSVMLSSSAATSYLWSNGETTQTIYATQSGVYTVQTQGLCQQWTSNVISVNAHPSPAPSANDVVLPAPGTATLTATGNNVVWFADPTGGSPLASGSNYTTPTITSDTVFYAEDSYEYGGGSAIGGLMYHPGGTASAQYSGNTVNAYEIFTANQNCILKSVKVYTDMAGVRTFELRSSTGTVLQDTTINVPVDTTVVNLNFTLTAGTSYQLGTNSAQNNTSFGFVSPRLRRTNSSTLVQYPYDVIVGGNSMVTITNSSQGSSLFYYFYEWNIEEMPVVCTSPRTAVHVSINPVGIASIVNDNDVRIYPNPSSDNIHVSLKNRTSNETSVVIYDMLGKMVYSENYTSATDAKTISVKDFKAGVYEITVSNGGKVYHSRFIVQ